MCPIRDKCCFYAKFRNLKHPGLMKIFDFFCNDQVQFRSCIHFQAFSSLGLELDAFVSPTCMVLPRPSKPQQRV